MSGHMSRAEFWVCVDCYFAHHYGAERVVREATDAEVAHWLHSEHNTYHAREVMGIEFTETPEGVEAAEWFAGDSDSRCEGGEPLRLIPEIAEVFDWTDSESGEGIDEFSWRFCDGCGSRLGGSRHRLAVDLPERSTT